MSDPASSIPDIPGISQQTQLYLTWAFMAWKFLGEVFSSWRAGGGIKRFFLSVWLGEQTPKVILDDYKTELKMPPVPPST